VALMPSGVEKPHVAYISVGSNIGDKVANCRRGVEALRAAEGVRITAQSRIYRTEPVDFTDQDWFVNYVIRVETSLDPFALLSRMQAAQRRIGRRQPGVRFGPRILDLDILFYDDRVLDDPRLSLPHPRLHQRRFVLKPLCDIKPDLVHPVLGEDVRTLLAALDENGQQVVEIQ
jgi:2-amino-4-hydroxy-6-hydroxymethyldihydropteridine diphosphokinase